MLVTLVRTHYNRDISKGGALLRSRSPGVVPGSAHHHKEVMAMKKKIITVSREFGSGGRTIGKTVAQRLNIPYYDKELVKQVALESGFDPKGAGGVRPQQEPLCLRLSGPRRPRGHGWDVRL